jgi:hypothetical protein
MNDAHGRVADMPGLSDSRWQPVNARQRKAEALRGLPAALTTKVSAALLIDHEDQEAGRMLPTVSHARAIVDFIMPLSPIALEAGPQ